MSQITKDNFDSSHIHYDHIMLYLDENEDVKKDISDWMTQQERSDILSFVTKKRDVIIKKMLHDGIEPPLTEMAKLEAYQEIFDYINQKQNPHLYDN